MKLEDDGLYLLPDGRRVWFFRTTVMWDESKAEALLGHLEMIVVSLQHDGRTFSPFPQRGLLYRELTPAASEWFSEFVLDD